jgi:hypothetical protein
LENELLGLLDDAPLAITANDSDDSETEPYNHHKRKKQNAK